MSGGAELLRATILHTRRAIDEIHNGKPNPEGFLLAAERLGVLPAECLVFEDTRPGIEAGLRAGMQVVGLLTTVPAQQLGHWPLIRDFRNVTIKADGEELKLALADQSQSAGEPGL